MSQGTMEFDDLFRADVQCFVRSLSYDFWTKEGNLRMSAFNCCDMTGCIKLFKAIDPDVKTIITWAGEKRDTSYRYIEGPYWKAILPDGGSNNAAVEVDWSDRTPR